ncbi:hypothetical protein [Bacillus sp. J33]|uniref:hypothetical protein n=1 Tax=Bacillus sp. J33 TaxID=935836 RepID=UPI0004B98600|nr:hypothetical protein [Bacillus sp. J33]
MKILLSLLLVILVVLTAGTHIYFVWRKKDFKTLMIQIGIAGLAILAGIVIITDLSYLSISKILNTISPLEK